MELPQDIHSLLERYLKPKRYTLLNKFCRDFYFRKHGLYIKHIGDTFERTNLMSRYRIKILYIDANIDNIIPVMEDYSENVISISLISNDKILSIHRYLNLRKTFANLEKFECKIEWSEIIENFLCVNSKRIKEILNFKSLPGTVIALDASSVDVAFLEQMITAEYVFEVPYFINYGDLTPEIIKNIRGVEFDTDTHNTDIMLYPYLEYIIISNDLPDYNIIEGIKNHPTIKEARFDGYFVPDIITKTDGVIIKNKFDNGGLYNDIGQIFTQEDYDLAKKQTDTIIVFNRSHIDKLIVFEKNTTYSKKMTLNFQAKVDHTTILENIGLFNISIPFTPIGLKFYIIEFKKYKIKFLTDDRIDFVFKINNSRLILRTETKTVDD